MPSYYEMNQHSEIDSVYYGDKNCAKLTSTSSQDVLPSSLVELLGTADLHDDVRRATAKDGKAALDEGIAAVLAIHDEVIAYVERCIHEDPELFGYVPLIVCRPLHELQCLYNSL